MPRRLRDVDSADQVNKLRILYWAGAGGVIGGAIGSWRFGPLGFVLGAPLGYAAVYFFARALVVGAASGFISFLQPSGDSTPHKREYSLPQSFAMRGRFEEAINAYEAFVLEFPEEPEPYIRIARLYRDELQRFDDALQWFKKVRTAATLAPSHEVTVTQEIVEIYTLRLKEPRRAIPELARLADRFPTLPAAAWARQRIVELRAEMENPA